jgi:hypothetical protein
MAMLLSTPFSPRWFHEEDAPQLGSMNVMSGVIARTERKQPGIIPDLRRAPTLFIGSDSGGQHSDAEYEVTGFLCSNREALADWEAARSRLRETMLPNQRRMSYKGLNDKHRQRALLPFLAAANRIPGLLFLVAIDRRIESVFQGRSEIPELKSWKAQSVERLMRTIHIASLLARGMSAEGQDLWWFTDEDEIAANEERLRLLVNLFAGLTSNYLSHNMRHMRIGTTKSDTGRRDIEDYVSICDLAAGTVQDCLAREGMKIALKNPSLFIPKGQVQLAKVATIMDWLADNSQPLRRLILVMDEDGGRPRCTHLRLHGTRDPNSWLAL